jgi:cyclase
MNKRIRIIPRIDVKGVNVVKGIHLEGLRVLGNPSEFASNYYNSGADELIFMDSVASLYGRNNLHNIVSKVAEEIFIPMTVGGGIRSLDNVKTLLQSGADKVAINTALFTDPFLISEVSDYFGSQCMVVSIDTVRVQKDKYECLTDNGRERTGVDLFKWIERVVELGAGEILLTSVDNEGTGIGYDTDLLHKISKVCPPIPVIFCGGAGNKNHVLSAVKTGNIDGIVASSIFHYDLIKDGLIDIKNLTEEGNKNFLMQLQNGTTNIKKNINPISILKLKEFLLGNNVDLSLRK